MGQISIILIAGLLFLFSFEPLEISLEISDVQMVFWTFVLTVVPALLAYFATAYASRAFPTHEQENLPKRYTFKRFMIVFEVLSLCAYLCNLYLLNLPGFIDKHLVFFPMAHLRQIVSLLPLLIGLMCIRFAFQCLIIQEAPEEMHSDSAAPRPLLTKKYREMFSLQLKFLIFPLIPMFGYLVTVDLIYWLPYSAKLFIVEHPYVLIVLILPVLAFAYLFAPLLMQFLWKTAPLAEGSVLKEKLKRLTQQSGVKYRDIVVWQTGSLLIANAAVAGTLPWNRKIFLTESLLHYFTDEQIKTIVAHELGHIHYKHIPTYILFSLIYLLSYPLFYLFIEEPLVPLLEERLAFMPDLLPILLTLCSLLFFVVYFVLLFRYLSRRCEHQADLYAVELTDNPEAFKTALATLALLNALPKSIRRFFEIFNTHPSIHRRIEFVNQWIERSSAIQRYKSYLLEVKILIALLPIFCILAFLFI